MQSVPITTDVVGSIPAEGEEYHIMWYSWSVTSGRSVYSPGPPVSSINKNDHHDITEILLRVALNTIKQNQAIYWISTIQ